MEGILFHLLENNNRLFRNCIEADDFKIKLSVPKHSRLDWQTNDLRHPQTGLKVVLI